MVKSYMLSRLLSRMVSVTRVELAAVEFSIKAAEQLAAEKTYKDLVEQGLIVQAPA